MDGAINHVFQKSDLCGADQCRSHTTGHMQQSLAWCSSPDHMLVAKNVHLVSCHSWWRKLQGLESSSFSLLDSTGENKICFSSLSWSLMKKIEDYTFLKFFFFSLQGHLFLGLPFTTAAPVVEWWTNMSCADCRGSKSSNCSTAYGPFGSCSTAQ